MKDCKNREWIQKSLHGNGKDYTNLTLNRLTFLFPVKNLDDSKHSYWLCQCNCGNQIIVRPYEVIHEKIRSCGCLTKESTTKRFSKDLIGQTFGLLTCITRLKKNNKWYYHCKCQCGNEIDVLTASLINGNTKSCGCLKSWKENQIASYLQKHNIQFSQQYRFLDCKDKYPLPFDFIIYNQNQFGLIEYQGSQHYIKSAEWDTEETFAYRQLHDQIKLKYCQEHHIPLLILNKTNDIENEILNFYTSLTKKLVK